MNIKKFKNIKAIFAIFMLLIVIFAPCADAAAPAQPVKNVQKAQTINPPEMEAFLDGFFAAHMDGWSIPGIVFCAVYKGKVVAMKGYGAADIASGHAMSAQNTVIRAASVSKIFTALAVMIQTEQGKMSLEDDINKHLRRFQIDDAYPDKPVKIVNLLTHTGGFDDDTIGSAYLLESGDKTDFIKFLPKLQPKRVHPPGAMYGYSNYGMALAGAAVQSSSRKAFADFVSTRILKPLAMDKSGFNLTGEMSKNMAVGYYSDMTPAMLSGFYELPALSFNTTAADMSKFLLSFLSPKTVISQNTLHKMTAQSFAPVKGIDGTALGFYEHTIGGLRGLEHAGDLDGFSSLLYILPEKEFGFFYAANGDDTGLRDLLAHTLLNRYWPAAAAAGGISQGVPSQKNVSDDDLAKLTGSYRHIRYSRNTIEKAWVMLEDPLQVAITDGGGIELTYPPKWDKAQSYWAPLNKNLFYETEATAGQKAKQNTDKLAFVDGGERVSSMIIGSVYETYEPIGKFETANWQRRFLLIFLLAAISCMLGRLISAVLEKSAKRYERPTASNSFLWALLSFYWILQGAFLITLWLYNDRYGWELIYGVPLWLKALFFVPFIALLVLICALVIYVKSFSLKYSFLERILCFFEIMLCAGFYLFLNMWNLLGFNF